MTVITASQEDRTETHNWRSWTGDFPSEASCGSLYKLFAYKEVKIIAECFLQCSTVTATSYIGNKFYIVFFSDSGYFKKHSLVLKNGPSLASFSFIFSLFQTNITNFTTIQCEHSIQYTVMGFELNNLQTVSLLS